jgi:hypothetical protein
VVELTAETSQRCKCYVYALELFLRVFRSFFNRWSVSACVPFLLQLLDYL